MTEQAQTRIESDSMGEVSVPADRYWGAQTQRSLQNFKIGGEIMPPALIMALGIQKLAGAHHGLRSGHRQPRDRDCSRRKRSLRTQRL